MRILITGGRGQLAADLVQAFDRHDIQSPGREELDVSASQQVADALASFRPDVVVNTAAFHQVDLCETEPEASFLVNAAAPQRLAAACARSGALLVHFSTDYVFDGSSRRPYEETDPIGPINVYGASKAAGELAVRATTNRHLIVRTTGLYGLGGLTSRRGNFVETMLRLAAGGKALQVVSDQVLTPSFTEDVASAVVRLIEAGATGTFHVTNSGQCSWYEFAAEAFRLAGVEADLTPIRQSDRPVPATRPAYSVLAHSGIRRAGLPEIRTWREALATYIEGRTASLLGPSL